jgi:hypothetical protein
VDAGCDPEFTTTKAKPAQPKVNVSSVRAAAAEAITPEKLNGLWDALSSIVKAEGVGGLFRGLVPRLCVHAPSVAISWGTYEVSEKTCCNPPPLDLLRLPPYRVRCEGASSVAAVLGVS